ncbi:MAG: hypothetical protein ACO1QB_14295 [Verrucomicrobiales bacterium]
MENIEMRLAGKVSILRAKTWEELTDLPRHSQEDLLINNMRVIESVWTDEGVADSIRVVVQIYLPKILGFGSMQAAGFRKFKNGDSTDLTPDELTEFS